MEFGIWYPGGKVDVFRDEELARMELSYQHSELGQTSPMRHIYIGGVLVARTEGEDEWLEVVP